MNCQAKIAGIAVGGFAAGALACRFLMAKSKAPVESMPDQPARFAAQKAANDTRALDIEQHYDGSFLKGKRVVITGGNRGLGLCLAKEAISKGAIVIVTCRKSSAELEALSPSQIIEGIDVTVDDCMTKLVEELQGKPVDILVNNAGYFMTECEMITKKTMDFTEELKMIDICAVGVLRVTNALFNGGLLPRGSKVSMITSQGGSIAWRDVQCPTGGDYGHHMSKAAANMAGKLCANELKSEGVAVSILHPGFNRTGMTAKYSHIWDIEGAVDASVGAMRVFHEISLSNLDNSGTFINCEDGLVIPW